MCLRAGQYGDRIPVEAIFSAPIQTGTRAHPAPYTMDTGSSPGVKRTERDVDYSLSSTEVKERVVVYIYYLSGPSCFIQG